MSEEGTTRRLVAILAADVVDYSRRMHEDEAGTVAAWQSARSDAIDPTLEAHHGRVVKRTGDGFLAEFTTVEEAVRCAVALQEALTDNPLDFRMGINLGDITDDGDDIHGDGVNIAARLESLAEPGGILISDSVYNLVHNKLDLHYADLGEQQVKNIATPIRTYSIGTAPVPPPTTVEPVRSRGSVLASLVAIAVLAAGVLVWQPWAGPEKAEAPAPQTPPPEQAAKKTPGPKPAIAVLPFTNISADKEQEYFADGMTEDLITDLSKISGLLVIARNSVFAYKGAAVNVPNVCRELGVRWALEGSVRKAGNRVRVNAQLIDGATGGHLWAERFDRDLDDIFAVQDEVTAEIVDALKIKLSHDDEKRVGHRAKTDVENYEIYLQARKKLWSASKTGVEEARAMYDEVLARDPDFAPALGGWAIAMISLYTNQWTDDLQTAWDEAVSFAEKAVAADDNEASAHLALGVVRSWQKRREEARNHGRRVLELSPNNPEGHALLSNTEYYAGNFQLAVEEAESALRVDPHSPDLVWQLVGQAAYMTGDYAKAETALLKRIELNPATDTSHLYLAANYGRTGEAEAARFQWAEVFRVNPGYTLADRIKAWPFADADMHKRILAGLEMAGIDHQITLDAQSDD